MEDKITNFSVEVEKLFEIYKLQAEQNINLGNAKKKVTENDATMFVQLFQFFQIKLCVWRTNMNLKLLIIKRNKK